MENVLELKNVKYKNILKDITFSLKEKSFNILIGANGSGKTTIVNCIRNILNYEGSISLFNNYVSKNHDLYLYRYTGFFLDGEILFEDIIFEELLSILKKLEYNEDKAKKKIYQIAKKLDITEILFKKQNNLLEYEKTLLDFLVSIIHEPKLLIIDNDLENLDEKYKNKIFDYLKSQKNLTILFITNNSDYFFMSNNLLFLKDGKIVFSDSLDKAIEEEKLFIKCGASIPFIVDLSKKLISYELLDSIELDAEKMVDKIWK